MEQPKPLPEPGSPQGVSRPSLQSFTGIEANIGPLGVAAPTGWTNEAVTPSDLRHWMVVSRHKLILLLASVLGLAAGILWNNSQPRVYRASATFEVQRVNEDFLNMRSVVPTTPEMDMMRPDYDVRTQSELIQSRTVLERVLGEPNLQKRLLGEIPSPKLLPWLSGFFSQTGPRTPSQERALSEVVQRLNVRTRSSARLVEVMFDAREPSLAADFANSILEQFIQVNLEERWRSSQRTTEWLTHQLHDLKAKIEASELELQNYAQTWNLIFADEKDNVAVQRLRQLQEELLKARADLAMRQARYELASTAPADSLPEVLDDPTLKEYSVALTAVRRELAELQSSMTPEHPKVIKMMAQQSELVTTLEKTRANIVARIRNEYEEALRRENLVAADYSEQMRQISGQADKIARYNLLRREVDTSRQIYDSLFQRVKEAGLAAALPTSNIRIVDSARPPLAPYRPSLPVNSALGILCGLTAGVGIAYLRERSAKGFRNPGETARYLRLSELGVIPSNSDKRSRRIRQGWTAFLSQSATNPKLELRALQESDPNIAESCRIALPTLMFSAQNPSPKRVIIVSSAGPGEGKTTVCCNLGIALGKAGYRVLLIDGDTRRPQIHQFFGITNSQGLTDLLRGKAQDLCRETKDVKVHVLPSGPCDDPDLIFSTRLPQLLAGFRAKFDMILIDTPPVLQAPDARILAHHADAAILVVRAQQTDREAARIACELLEMDGVCLLGTILNDWKVKSRQVYGYHRYYGSYESHGPNR